MTPQEWADLFHSGATESKVFALQTSVQNYLGHRAADLPPMRTQDLAEALWPVAHAGEVMHLRKRMVDLLLRLAKGPLADFCTKSERPMGKFMGKPKYPLYWHPPKAPRPISAPAEVCPTCKRPIT